MGDFSHLSQTGAASMVDISGKQATARSATVQGRVTMPPSCVALLTVDAATEIARTARIAGIQAAKQTALLVPLCHQVALHGVALDIELDRGEGLFHVTATAHTEATTGVEMEALTAAMVAGLTIYDMIKAKAPEASVGPFVVVAKHGGKAGSWTRPQ